MKNITLSEDYDPITNPLGYDCIVQDYLDDLVPQPLEEIEI